MTKFSKTEEEQRLSNLILGGQPSARNISRKRDEQEEQLDRLQLHQADMTDFLNKQDPSTYGMISVSNITDWMTEAQTAALSVALNRT